MTVAGMELVVPGALCRKEAELEPAPPAPEITDARFPPIGNAITEGVDPKLNG